ncbi:DUF2148 domain-containing protein [Ignisphaera sp. 4213-co]|uniref:DUF2148 domain-containing protein n=1 Tax=Ignisphaera cupida TaxID=3050454 RepID=A0ABD4Z8Y1_9CREN|nr:DUF2148 domain-containing protein [Ignisphaera sp. 4213-co]MDK6029164.1 DUF2148 domain-containing protein [Ignisphaera sp. 4213-co]
MAQRMHDNTISEAVLSVAKLMAISAITAPKARGIDNVVVKILSDRDSIELLAKKMEELSKEYGEFFARDASNVRRSAAVVLIGCKIIRMGLKNPAKWVLDADTVCNIVNLGIAIGSAVKTASILNVDNRVMFSVGVAAQELGLIDADYAFGIPLSAYPKSIYFDRVWPPK